MAPDPKRRLPLGREVAQDRAVFVNAAATVYDGGPSMWSGVALSPAGQQVMAEAIVSALGSPTEP